MRIIMSVHIVSGLARSCAGAGRRREASEKGDKLDSLVEKYKAQLFGQPSASGAVRGAVAERSAALKRWYA